MLIELLNYIPMANKSYLCIFIMGEAFRKKNKISYVLESYGFKTMYL